MNYQHAILIALQYKSIYQGTVDEAEKAKRRAKNKVAKQSRKLNRGVNRG